ncbi:MAG: hypothetical protein OXU20_38510 [Myxococcales bacterium]|nr:hypothetical protein [Myxococcales bacterium]MDD9965180.1 hypothetical protein [Myxococcales bacterium]
MTRRSYLRRATIPVFATHVVKTLVALWPALSVLGLTAQVPGGAPQPSHAETLFAIAFAVGQSASAHASIRTAAMGTAAIYLVCAPLAQAWWLRVMYGDNPSAGLRSALRALPTAWLLYVAHLCLQTLWCTAGYSAWLLLDLQVGSIQQPHADAIALLVLAFWGLGAALLWTWVDIALARRMLGCGHNAAWLIPDRARHLLPKVLAKLGLRAAEIAILAPAFVVTLLAWPTGLGLLVLAVHQLAALAATFVRALWCAHTCQVAKEQVLGTR